jgi:hypothetical protein
VVTLAMSGIDPGHALALWEAYTVGALLGTAGLPIVGLDLQDLPGDPERAEELVKLLTGLGIEMPAEAGSRLCPRSVVGEPPRVDGPRLEPRLAELADELWAGLAPALAAATGLQDPWMPPADLAISPWAEAVLAAHRAAHRSACEATLAWGAAHAAQEAAAATQTGPGDAARELVGPDPLHYLEMRRELWRLRDEIQGLEAGQAHFRTAYMRADANRLVAEQRTAEVIGRLDALERIRDERDAMLESEQWRVGRLVLRPFTRLRRLLSGQ